MDITQLLIDPSTTVTMPFARVVKMAEDLAQAQSDRDNATRTAETANKQAMTLAENLDKERSRSEDQRREIIQLKETIQNLTKPPVVVPPVIPAPRGIVINKTQISGVAGLTIEKGLNEPNNAMRTEVRNVLYKAKGIGFNVWRGFFNLDEVRKTLKMQRSDPNHLPEYGRTQGLDFIADTVDSILPKLDINGQREYLKGLEAMGACAVVINDADRYEAVDLIEWTDAVRRVLPTMPIIASLRGNASISAYPMFDLYEAQTFGTADELKNFLFRPFDIWCLDARTPMTAKSLKEHGDIMLAQGKGRSFFYYADLAGDWLKMPADEVETIKRVVSAWKAAR